MLVVTNEFNSRVYGAFNFGESDTPLTVDVVELITAELPVPDSLPIYQYNFAIAWALTIFVVDFDPSAVKAYSVPTGRFQFGEIGFFAANAAVDYQFQFTNTQLYPYRRFWSYLRGIPVFDPGYVPAEISRAGTILPLQTFAPDMAGRTAEGPASSFIFTPQKSVTYVAQVGYIASSALVVESEFDYILWLTT